MAAPYYSMIEEVCVMLVDNDKAFVTVTVDLLKSYDYKVITVDTASTAMAMLSEEKKKIDVMIINVHSSNLLSFELLAQAVDLDIISLCVCDEHNELLAKKTLDKGAYLYLKKPFDAGIVKYLWQFVLRKKIEREKAREEPEKNEDQMNVEDIGNNNIIEDNEEQYGERENVSNIEGQSQRSAIDKVVRRKACIEWTEDLHGKFIEAMQLLGEGRCYPKDILEVMNVPNLTRTQVASHLQKCRINKWRASKERKYIRHPSDQASSSGSQQRSSFKKFGTMPHLQTNVLNLQRSPDKIQRGPEFSFPNLNTNNVFARGESSIQELYRPQLQVQPHYFSIDNSFNNPFFSAQNNVDGGIQQNGSFFEMSSSQEQQGPIIGNPTYRPSLTFNCGSHHIHSDFNLDFNAAHKTTYFGSEIISATNIETATINDYNLNVNADNVTSYSSSAMMFDAYVENASTSGFAAANANEKENCDAYLNFNNVANQNLNPPRATLPNEQDSEFDHVYSDDQVAGTSNV